MRSTACLALVLALSACSAQRGAEFFLLGSHFEHTRGIAYGEGSRELLDVYTPQGLDRPAPVVVFFYGGRWQTGSRDTYRLLGDALTRRGIVTVIPDYTLYPDTLFPGWVEESARAVAWTHANIERFGGDPSRIFITGHSAGAHSAALLGLDEHYLEEAGVPAASISGVVSISGPVHTRWTDPDVQTLMGPEEDWPGTYADNFVDGTEPPMLLLHGEEDETLSTGNSTRLASTIVESGGCARTILYPGLGHIEIIVAMMAPWLRRPPVRDDLVAFITDPRGFAECAGVTSPTPNPGGQSGKR